MRIRTLLAALTAALSVAGGMAVTVAPASAATAPALSPHSWDPGLHATVGDTNTTAHAWGQRTTPGAWGTGPVNYQAGATAVATALSSGTLNVTLRGSYCPTGACAFGAGTGYKGLVQLWNDPRNYVAFGVIHDPGVSPSGTTLMIEGAANGRPVGGYWAGGKLGGASHLFTVTWGTSGISLQIDHQTRLGPYPVAATHPSISFLAAGRLTGDIADTTFTGISIDTAPAPPPTIAVPSGAPYLSYSATMTEAGSGTGYSAYINAHDAGGNAISVGIQSDTAAPESGGQPYYIWERVQNGTFTHGYLGPASHNPEPVTLKWWQGADTAVFYAGSTPIASVPVHLTPRLFFNVEGNARLNGDSVRDTFSNVQISVGNNCPNYCGLNGAWNTKDFNFYGLKAVNTNGQTQNGANFTVTGTASGVPAGADWDTTPNPLAGIAMIAQRWNGA
jgi:hypothetical protein